MKRKVKHGGFAGQLFEMGPDLMRRSVRERERVEIETAGLKKNGMRVIANKGLFGNELTVQFKPGVFDFKRFSLAVKRLFYSQPRRSKFGRKMDQVTGIKKRRAAEEIFLAEWGSSEYKKGYIKIAGKEYFAVFKHSASGVSLAVYSLNLITKSPTSISVVVPKILEVNHGTDGITGATFWKPYKDETAHLMKLVLNAEVIKPYNLTGKN